MGVEWGEAFCFVSGVCVCVCACVISSFLKLCFHLQVGSKELKAVQHLLGRWHCFKADGGRGVEVDRARAPRPNYTRSFIPHSTSLMGSRVSIQAVGSRGEMGLV